MLGSPGAISRTSLSSVSTYRDISYDGANFSPMVVSGWEIKVIMLSSIGFVLEYYEGGS